MEGLHTWYMAFWGKGLLGESNVGLPPLQVLHRLTVTRWR